MSALSVYLKKQEKVVNHLVAAVRQIPEDKINWKPCDKSLPWLYLIHHTSIGRRHVLFKCIQGKETNFPACFKDPAYQTSSTSDARATQLETWSELKGFLKTQPEDFANKIVTFPGGYDMAVERILWMMYEENVHHRGQAWLYARMNGITPPSIWGSEDRT